MRAVGTLCSGVERSYAEVKLGLRMTAIDSRAEAIALARQMLDSCDHLVVRMRHLKQLLLGLDVDLHSSEELMAIVAVDSEADAWPIGVGPDQLDSEYRLRCEREMQSYGEQVWQPIRGSCRAVLTLLSRPN